MNKNFTKPFLKLFFLGITIVLLSGCSTFKEETKKYVKIEKTHKIEITLYYIESSDTLIKEEYKLIVTKPSTHSEDEVVTIHSTLNYSELNFEKVSLLGIDEAYIYGEDNVSFSRFESVLTLKGFKEVTE